MLQELIELCGESTDSLGMLRREHATLQLFWGSPQVELLC